MDVNANSKLKRKKKTHGPGNPSKRHRDRLNAELDNLARLLPFPEEIVTKLDKISILRLTVSYLRAKSFFQVSNGRHGNEETCEELVREVEGNGVFSQLSLEALDGFIVVITQDGQLFYVSENVREFLGYSQAAVIHQSVFKFLHIDDQDMVKTNLAWPKPAEKKVKLKTEDKHSNVSGQDERKTDDSNSLNRSFTCRMKCTLNHGGGFYKLFRLSGRLREIHTRKRDSQVLEYGLFAICSPANNSHSHHTGATVKKEVALTAQKRLERANSEPICGRRAPLPLTGMLPTMPMSHHYSGSETRSTAVSPLASPAASTDSGHPSPDSSQGGKLLLTDSDIRSDSSEVSPPSSSSSHDIDGRLAADHLMTGLNHPFMHAHRLNRKRRTSFMDSLRPDDKDNARKRSRSLADASELFVRDGMDPRSFFFRGNLPAVPEIKVENTKRKEECTQSSEVSDRRPLNAPDNRLDAAQGLVSLGNMASKFPALCAFPPDFMYPDVMFQRDMLHDLQHLRAPFDMHNPYCLGNDPYTALAMRRWLTNPDMFHSPLNPMLAAQAGLLSPAERLRFLKFPFASPAYFPGASPFDLGAISGFTERNLPEYALRGFHRNGLASPDMARNAAAKETDRQQTPPREKQYQVQDNRESKNCSSPSKTGSPDAGIPIKKEPIPSEKKGKDTKKTKEETFDGGGKSAKVCSTTTDDDDREEEVEVEEQEERVDVVGGTKPASGLRQTFAGIQEEFNSRLENLNKSFALSLDQNMTCP
ncbi:PREDICTED: uncharacterized protein LOC107339895 isoform X2 [Acropora digitifera]|uniref:uncharacterized protein LOC107339895 isoform X2 n=1 Tax=Acropora digitifera TaxID=70779 RepID=UPI00077A9101|nr:PREDICTED: uncharacterized protein LOC107339895 isoform X2 [Acropora digitifera]